MIARRWLVWGGCLPMALLVAPPGFVWAKQLSLAAMAVEDRGSSIAATQLYAAWQHREGFVRPANLSSHPYMFPYMECDAHLPDSMSTLDIKLMSTFMRDHELRLSSAYAQILDENLSTVATTGLTACLSASVISAICADRVRNLTYGHNTRVNQIMAKSDREHAAAYCQSIKGILETAKSK